MSEKISLDSSVANNINNVYRQLLKIPGSFLLQ